MTNEEVHLEPWIIEEERYEFDYDKVVSGLDSGKPGFRLAGLRDITGTFSGSLADGIQSLDTEQDIKILYLYGPDPNLPWWKHWFYRIRQALGRGDYPSIVLASGPATMKWEKEHEDGDDVVFEGSFTAAGKWDFHDGVKKEEVDR